MKSSDHDEPLRSLSITGSVLRRPTQSNDLELLVRSIEEGSTSLTQRLFLPQLTASEVRLAKEERGRER
jgi:hypothetical protein